MDSNVQKFGYCSVVVSEGVKGEDGKFLSDQGIRDAFGHAQLGGVAPVVANIVREGLGLKYHWGVADYLQRAARHIASKTDVEQAYAMGKAAVEFAIHGHNSVMPTIERLSNTPYKWKVGMAQLSERGKCGKNDAQKFHQPGRLWYHGQMPGVLAPLIKGRTIRHIRMACRPTCG